MKDFDPYTGVQTRYHHDPTEDKMIVERVQDVEPTLNLNKREFNDAPETGKWKGNYHKVASIPLVVIEQYKNLYGVDLLKDKDAMRKFLNDPDHKFLRTKPGRV